MSLTERISSDMPPETEEGDREAWRLRPPVTSTTLLRDIQEDVTSERWAEFVQRYWPMMEAFLAKRHVEADAREDIILVTLAALVKQLPNYRYSREEGKPFHNYLTGILEHKRLDAWKAKEQRKNLEQKFGEWLVSNGRIRPALDYDTGDEDGMGAIGVLATEGEPPGVSEADWKEAIVHIAMQQLLADEELSPRSRDIFRRTQLNHEPVEAVAESLMMTRAAVDQVNHRMRERLAVIAKRLLELDGP